MAAKLRQEINILDSILTAASGSSATSNEIVSLDTTKYNGATYYFEILADSSVSLGFNVTLVGATDGTLATISVPVLTTAYTLFRSSSFTVTSALQDCTIQIANTVGATKNVKAARIIILQSASIIANTETQIEIGNASATTQTVDTNLTNPKYWKYDASKWDGTLTVYFESTFMTGTSKSAATMTLQTSTDILAPSWSNVTSSAVTTTGTVPTRVRSGAITLVDGNWYQCVMKAGNSKSGITTYNAKIIIDQVEGSAITIRDLGSNSLTGRVVGGSSAPGEAQAQSFKITNATNAITGVKLWLAKSGSPVDSLNVDIVSSLGGGSLANGTISGASLSGIFTQYTITFGTPFSASANTTYYIQLTRSPDVVDTTNFYDFTGTSSNVYSLGDGFSRNNPGTVWNAGNNGDHDFELTGIVGITKVQPQYLLANTLFAAGTALQLALTKWDSTEWDAGSGSITYTFQAEAANGSTSDVELWQANGGGSGLGVLTNIDNAQISSAVTMPTSQNMDTKATTNAGDIAAARILVAYVFSAAVATFIAQKPLIVNQAINRAGTY